MLKIVEIENGIVDAHSLIHAPDMGNTRYLRAVDAIDKMYKILQKNRELFNAFEEFEKIRTGLKEFDEQKS